MVVNKVTKKILPESCGPQELIASDRCDLHKLGAHDEVMKPSVETEVV